MNKCLKRYGKCSFLEAAPNGRWFYISSFGKFIWVKNNKIRANR